MGRISIGERLFLASTLFILLLMSMLFTLPAAAAGNVQILSSTGYLDSSNNYDVVGEVQYTGTQAATLIQLQAIFYDPQGTTIYTESNITMLIVLLAGRKSPFEIDLSNPSISTQVHRYDLSLTYLDTIAIPLGLEISSTSSTIDATGRMHLAGRIKNIGAEKTFAVKIAATYYDGAARVVAAASASPTQRDLDPDKTAQFEIIISQERTTHVVTYALTAESSQYALVPELSPWTSIPLLLTAATITALTHKRRLRKP